MRYFLLGVLVTSALHHIGGIKHLIHEATGDGTELPSPYHPVKGVPPRLPTKVAIQEPDLDKMEELGFNVERK